MLALLRHVRTVIRGVSSSVTPTLLLQLLVVVPAQLCMLTLTADARLLPSTFLAAEI